jgi:hypothetical protein
MPVLSFGMNHICSMDTVLLTAGARATFGQGEYYLMTVEGLAWLHWEGGSASPDLPFGLVGP